MDTASRSGSRFTGTLILIVLLLTGLLVLTLFFSLPAPEKETEEDPEEIIATEEPTEEESWPTEPLVELNPYGTMDFQYDGRYLKLLEGESITGIDVSAHQGAIDWEKVAASGVDFAMIRLAYRGYGTGKIANDIYAQDNLEGAAEAGLKLGIYFFSQATSVEEAIEEANYVLRKMGGHDVTMPVVFDWEHVGVDDARTNDIYDKRLLTDCALAFLQTIEEAGYWPMIYFNTSQSRNLFYLDELEEYDFWLALYSNRMTFPYKVKMWQYTCTGKVPGVQGDCDINIFFPET